MSAILSFILPVLLVMGSAKNTEPETPLIPRKVLFGNTDKTNPQISPDGNRLAFLSPNRHGVMNIWVRTLGKSKPRLVTQDEGRGIHRFLWQNDNDHILYLQDLNGDENWHLYQVHLASERSRDLTPFENVQAHVLKSDSRFPNEIIITLNKRDPRYHDAYHLNLSNGNLTLVAENHFNARQFLADHNMNVRAALLALETGGEKVIYRDDSGEWKDLMEWTADDDWQAKLLGFSPDNNSLWMINSVGARTQRVVEVDLRTKHQRVLFAHPEYDARSILTHPETNEIQAAFYLDHALNWKVIDYSLTKDYDTLRKAHKGDLRIQSRDLKDRYWIVSYTRDDAPRDFYLYNKKKKKLNHLFSEKDALNEYTLAKTKPITFTARDGMKIHGYLTLPPEKKKPHPMVLLIHGGPWLRDKWEFNPKVQWLANRGYAVLQVNYRGSAGYGKTYLNASKKEWGRKMHYDVMDGKKWAVEAGYANPKKVAIFGRSFGGYATLVGMTSNPKDFCCGISVVGPSNLISLFKTIPPYWHIHRVVWNKMVGHHENEKELLKERSPLFKAHLIRRPLLIAHGANDARVKKSESDQIVKAMRDKNLPVKYLVFPDEGHGFVRAKNQMKFFAAAEEFLSEHMGGRYEPPTEDEEWQHLSTNP